MSTGPWKGWTKKEISQEMKRRQAVRYAKKQTVTYELKLNENGRSVRKLKKSCMIRGCNGMHWAKDLCKIHYDRFQAHFANHTRIERHAAKYLLFDVHGRRVLPIPPFAEKVLLALTK